MALYLIGLGLADEKDISVKGLEIVKSCDLIYLESYTSLLQRSKECLEQFYGKKVFLAAREFTEQKTKKIKTILKLQLEAGKANPAPPVGTALGPHGINIQDFCRQFNDATKDMTGDVVPAEITIFEDRTFTFILKTPPAAALLKKAAGIEKGSGTVPKVKAGKVSREDVRKIAERKMTDLNANDIEAAEKIVMGTARSMGIDVEKKKR